MISCGGVIAFSAFAAFSASAAIGVGGPDRPAEGVLGYHLDISNCKVPRLEMMYRIVDILQRLGYNHL